MSISNILQDNSFKIYCGTLDTENITVAGVPVAVDNLVQRTNANVLNANTLIAGDGTNIVKDTNIVVTDDNMNLPALKGYYIGNQNVLYDNAGVYTVEADLIQAHTALETNLIRTEAINEDLNINSTGTGSILLNSATDTGVRVLSSSATNGALYTSNLFNVAGVQTGTNFTTEHKPVVNGVYVNQTEFSGLWCQNKGIAPLILGNPDIGTVNATGTQKLYCDGNVYVNGNIKNSGTIQTNNITSVGASDNIIIDANGSGRILFPTTGNGGVKITGSNTTSYPLMISNSTDLNSVVIGTYYDGTTHNATIGANTSTFSAWKPLWLQTSGDTTPIICGSGVESTAIASGSKLFINGNVTSTSDIKSSVLSASNNIYLQNTGSNYHLLTSTVPASQYTHTFPNATGTIAQSNNICIYNKGGVTPILPSQEFLLVDGGLSRLEVMAIIPIGVTMNVGIEDELGTRLISILLNGTGTTQYGSSTSVLLPPASLQYASIEYVLSSGIIGDLYNVRVFGALI